ncbi:MULTISPECIES: hypothetical protein [Streptomyces]|jgi:hypothetical protein|uniref:Uncharacterized protein n=1 Tax=Streptomyces sp. 900129855 TaxID=3155129 RepID=A0ABV2ZYM6_9ACTN
MTTAPGIAKKRLAVRVTAALATAAATFGIIAFGFTGGSANTQAADPGSLDCSHYKCHNY